MIEGAAFRGKNGLPVKNFRIAWEGAVKRASLEVITFHDLRHTFASRLVMAGMELRTVQEPLGHICRGGGTW